MKLLSVIALALLSTSVMAKDVKVKYVTKSKTTGKKAVMFVGTCMKTTNFDDTHSYVVEYSVCKEKVNYKVKVEGSFWNSKSSVVPGSETAPYYNLQTERKSFRVSQDQDNLGQVINTIDALTLCRQQRDVLKQQAKIDKTKAIYTPCSEL